MSTTVGGHLIGHHQFQSAQLRALSSSAQDSKEQSPRGSVQVQ